MDAPIGIQLTAVEGPMARRVADLRAAFEVMAGPSWRDPWSAVEPPSIDVAARTLLDLLNTPEVRAGWHTMAPLMPADTQRFMSAFYEVPAIRTR